MPLMPLKNDWQLLLFEFEGPETWENSLPKDLQINHGKALLFNEATYDIFKLLYYP